MDGVDRLYVKMSGKFPFRMVTTESSRTVYINFKDAEWRAYENVEHEIINPLPSSEFDVDFGVWAWTGSWPDNKEVKWTNMEIGIPYLATAWVYLCDTETGDRVGAIGQSWSISPELYKDGCFTVTRIDRGTWKIEADAWFIAGYGGEIIGYTKLTFVITVVK